MALITEMIRHETKVDGPGGTKLTIEIYTPVTTDTETGDKYGCTDRLAMNYCPTCNKDDGTCIYLAAT